MLFQGRGRPLTESGLEQACGFLGVGPAELWAVLHVETAGRGFLDDRRPVILYERHIFHRLTEGRFDVPPDMDPISLEIAGGYGAPGAAQYQRLDRAMALDREAALRSTSWGIGQVLGANFSAAGYTTAEEMAIAMGAGEDNQLAAMAVFLWHAGLAPHLAGQDWASFARGYNGPGFAKNEYHLKLAAAVKKPVPDLRVRAAQLYLRYAGMDPGPVDGVLGVKTLEALYRWRVRQGVPADEGLDQSLERLEKGYEIAAT